MSDGRAQDVGLRVTGERLDQVFTGAAEGKRQMDAAHAEHLKVDDAASRLLGHLALALEALADLSSGVQASERAVKEGGEAYNQAYLRLYGVSNGTRRVSLIEARKALELAAGLVSPAVVDEAYSWLRTETTTIKNGLGHLLAGVATLQQYATEFDGHVAGRVVDAHAESVEHAKTYANDRGIPVTFTEIPQ